MGRRARTFLIEFGEELASELGGDFRLHKTHLELKRPCGEAYDVIAFHGSNKYSPRVHLDFLVGKYYREVDVVRKAMGEGRFPCHVTQRGESTRGGWSVDIEDPPPGLVEEVANCLRQSTETFFRSFASMRHARDALANGSKLCAGGSMAWRQVLMLDLALNELDHFQGWRRVLDDRAQWQADLAIRLYLRSRRDD